MVLGGRRGLPGIVAGCLLTVFLWQPLGAEQPSLWTAGASAVFLQPRLGHDTALRITEEDLAGNVRIVDENFARDFTAAPRTWLRYESAAGIGLNVQWWMLTSQADTLTRNPPANGFGEIAHPSLYGVDLSSVVPAESLSATSALDIYAIDLEVTKRVPFDQWDLLVAAGMRHAGLDRQDGLQLRNTTGALAGVATLDESLSGLGPRLRLRTERPVFEQFSWSADLATSLLVATNERRLRAIEDMDLTTPFSTNFATNSDLIVPIMETAIALQWQGQSDLTEGLFFSGGLEAQWWAGVGSLNSDDTNLSLFGLSLSGGYRW